MRRRHESKEMSNSLTQPQTGSTKLKWKMTLLLLLLIWALTVSAQLSLSDPSTTLASMDDWLRLCSHNHIHLLLYTQCNQAKSISTIKTSKIKNFVIDLCIVLLIVIPISLCFILTNRAKFWKNCLSEIQAPVHCTTPGKGQKAEGQCLQPLPSPKYLSHRGCKTGGIHWWKWILPLILQRFVF